MRFWSHRQSARNILFPRGRGWLRRRNRLYGQSGPAGWILQICAADAHCKSVPNPQRWKLASGRRKGKVRYREMHEEAIIRAGEQGPRGQ